MFGIVCPVFGGPLEEKINLHFYYRVTKKLTQLSTLIPGLCHESVFKEDNRSECPWSHKVNFDDRMYVFLDGIASEEWASLVLKREFMR